MINTQPNNTPAIASGSKRTMLLILGFLTIIVIVIIAFSILNNENQAPITTSTASRIETLERENLSYSKANQAFDRQDFAEAQTLYESALAEATRTDDEGIIKLKIAVTVAYSGDYLRAMPLLKEIVTEPKYLPSTRGYAVQEMGNLYYRTADPRVTEIIFSSEPFKSLVNSADQTSTKYRRLYEYAVSIHPNLFLAHFYIAEWYVDNLKEGSEARDSYLAQIESHIAAANEALEGRKSRVDYSTGLNRKAAVSAKLFLAGERDILGDPESLFEQALSISPRAAQEPFTRYAYAVFLATVYGKARSDKISELLSIIPTLEANAPFLTLIKNSSNRGNDSRVFDNFSLLASLDPKFADFLKQTR